MRKARIYTTMMCSYCARAMSLLKEKGVEIIEIPAGYDREKKAEMIRESDGGTTFPQIFIGDTHVGGSDDLMALEREGKLDALLQDKE